MKNRLAILLPAVHQHHYQLDRSPEAGHTQGWKVCISGGNEADGTETGDGRPGNLEDAGRRDL